MHERRRLLERLQHPVGGLVAELVDALDHEHAAPGLERRPAGRRDDRAVDVADEDLVGAARGDPGQIGMRPRGNSGADAGRVGGLGRQQLGGHRAGGGALAGAAGAVEQIGVRCPPAGRERRLEDGACVGVALQLGEHPPIVVAGRVGDHAQ